MPEKMKYEPLFHSFSFFFFFIFHFFFKLSVAVDSITPNQTISDNDNSTLTSPAGNFKLGFFSPPNSSNRYVGIWFAKVPVQTVVWVANRNSIIPDSSGSLSVTSSGDIVISGNNSSLWNSNSSSTALRNPVLRLLDNGNLVLHDAGTREIYHWQSFDFPGDTLIPGMRLGWNLKTNQELYLTSWRSAGDPSTGEFTYRMNPKGLPAIILRRGSAVTFRSGPWDGVRFGGAPALQKNAVFTPIFVFNSTYVYYAFENTQLSIVSRFVVTESGALIHFLWSESGRWINIATMQADTCDDYAKCGKNGVCEFGRATICSCLTGFGPVNRQDWDRFDWREGCARNTPVNCSSPAGFRRFSDFKVPETYDSVVETKATSRDECEQACLRNCSCVAFANTQASGCVLWNGDLLDIRTYSSGGQELFVKMPLSELGSSNSRKAAVIASVTVVSFVLVLVLALIIWFCARKRTGNEITVELHDYSNQDNNGRIGDDDIALPLIDFTTISAATDQFSFANKIGEGGFGTVYKGVLSTGKEIAVKRLSEDSGQGLHEFKNEVILIAKLQHRNLVRLLGCCIHRNERILIYEYMPNKSLDHFIFNRTKDASLEWETRLDIILGIARGLLYLHRDSRLRIIHRDLKASNILLDSEMNPKISDFGLARTFGADQHQENTRRVMGTYGYMAPEYTVDGIFSAKSDVFSFGVLVLEIISGRKNRGFYHTDHDHNLLGHAWKLWMEGNAGDFVDEFLVINKEWQVLRCIQVGLLCVQQRAEDRPTMSKALSMLESDHIVLDQPKEPGFYAQRTVFDTDSSSTGNKPRTSNQISVTLLHGR